MRSISQPWFLFPWPSAGHQFTLPDNRSDGTSALHGVSVSTLAFTSTHCAYSWTDGQAELTWVAWLNAKMAYPCAVTHLSINLAQLRITTLMQPTMLSLDQASMHINSPYLSEMHAAYVILHGISLLHVCRNGMANGCDHEQILFTILLLIFRAMSSVNYA